MTKEYNLIERRRFGICLIIDTMSWNVPFRIEFHHKRFVIGILCFNIDIDLMELPEE